MDQGLFAMVKDACKKKNKRTTMQAVKITPHI
jgi:hypothetical protein